MNWVTGRAKGSRVAERICAGLTKTGRSGAVRKIAARFGVGPDTVQRISRPFEGARTAIVI